MAATGLRFSDVQFALDISDVSLRNWLKRGQATIETPYGGGWSTFTINDVAHLALVRVFVDLGRRVEEANALAQAAAKLIRKGAKDRDDPAAMWKGKLLIVIRKGGIWSLSVQPQEQAFYSQAFIAIDVASELRPVIERARNRLEERQQKTEVAA